MALHQERGRPSVVSACHFCRLSFIGHGPEMTHCAHDTYGFAAYSLAGKITPFRRRQRRAVPPESRSSPRGATAKREFMPDILRPQSLSLDRARERPVRRSRDAGVGAARILRVAVYDTLVKRKRPGVSPPSRQFRRSRQCPFCRCCSIPEILEIQKLAKLRPDLDIKRRQGVGAGSRSGRRRPAQLIGHTRLSRVAALSRRRSSN